MADKRGDRDKDPTPKEFQYLAYCGTGIMGHKIYYYRRTVVH